jgi:formylglycine-generating enzyme required for sulfatase activity
MHEARDAMKRALAAAIAIALASCTDTERVVGPPGSIALYLDTDAPLPPAGGLAVLASDPQPLFDRVAIEVFAPGSRVPCAGCVNTFALDADLLRQRAASIVIAPLPGTAGYRARVRLFLAANTTADGEPDPRATVDVTVALPSVGADGRTDVTVTLLTDAVGVPAGTLDAPVDAAPGRPATSRVGTWPDAARVDCADPPREGEVCVPGGAFWMGTERDIFTAIPSHDALGPRLVVLAPFYLDATEMTVARYRAAKGVALEWSGETSGDTLTDFCTTTKTPGPNEDRPANCMNWASARSACAAFGEVLPTEAQLEYVASGLGRHRFVWGDDQPACGDAVFGRTGYGKFSADSAPCKPPVSPGGPAPVGGGALDRLTLPTGTIVDIAGNVGEFARDDWNRHDEPCWAGAGVYRDPLCIGKSAADGATHSERGGDWLVTGGQLTRTARTGNAPAILSPEIGFRCGRPATPAN